MFPMLNKLLECPICFNVLTLPVAWCRGNGHTICSYCKKYVKCCPYCQSRWSQNRHLLLEQILRSLISSCKYCRQFMDIEMLPNHELRLCTRKPMQCFLFNRKRRCNRKFPKGKLLDHLCLDHGRRMWKIFLNETVAVPIKNVFYKKNFSILYQVCLSHRNRSCFFILFRLYCTKSEFLCFSVNLIHEGDGEVDQYMFTFSIRRRGVEVHSFEGVCIPTFDIPEPPDRYPGGQPTGRITLENTSPFFTDPSPDSFNFYLKIKRPQN